ncbi:HAD family hydrolase [Calothrix sp. NIES-2098]|uniref:HAD family hydrolase n=1 Tax=Calothrix sp. NIES-2098 TaxID=1954171 RepID=UPI000B610956|nr:putative hydrolase [Calothrix sp. NIES-2098]
MGILIDLDQTLIDSQVAEQFRRNKQWSNVYKLIPQLYAYPGISELLKEIKAIGVPICIVTSSPRPYCEKVIKHCDWKIDATVCYHDTTNHKPHPDPIQKGLLSLGLEASEAVAIGDAAKDIQAAKAAGVLSIGTLWGSLEKDLLKASKPDIVCETVTDLREILLVKYKY